MISMRLTKCGSESLRLTADEEVIALARAGSCEAMEYLIDRYRPMVHSRARSYFAVGTDRDDLVQEGMIGLYKAIRDYQFDRSTSFRSFADLCVTRQIITAIKAASRGKHHPLNQSVELSEAGLTVASGETLANMPYTPTDLSQEFLTSGRVRHAELSELELGVLRCYLSGKSYREMSGELDCCPKTIDNALQRIKRKLGNTKKA